MKFIPVLLLFLTCFTVGYAQNHVTIKGRVTDSLDKKPLELSTIAIVDVKDTSLIAYTLSKKNGDFELRSLPYGKKIKLVVSFTAYKSYIKIFTFNKNDVLDLGDIALSNKMLNEVVIRAERVPISIKKDTIEFSADAFKTRPNAVVEELLKKLPGLQVNGDGSITVNGKSVSKVLIDGKQFFGGDLKIATKNLDAAIVGSIQVYDDRENDPDHLISDNKVQKVINLKLKKAIKRSIFGKVFAGGGTRDRYESGGLFNLFRDTLQLSIIGLSNNLNKTAFSNDDLYSQGGFDRSGGNSLYNGTVNTGGQNWGGGIEKITSGGFNLNTDYGKKLKVNLLYFYSQKNNSVENSAYIQRFLKDTTLLSNSKSKQQSDKYAHSLSGLVDWNPDTLHTIHYAPKLMFNRENNSYDSFSDTYNNFGNHLNTVNSSSSNTSNSTQFSQEFYYNKRFKHKKGASFNIGHSLQVNPSKSDSYQNNDLQSFTPAPPSDTMRRYSAGKNNNISANLNGSIIYPFTKKIKADISVNGTYAQSGNESNVFDRNKATGNYDIFLASQSVNLKRNQFTENLRPGITYDVTKSISIVANLGFDWQQVQDKFVTVNQYHNYLFLLPSIRTELGPVTLSYNRSANQPSINSLQPQTIVYNQLYSFTGNPLLKPSTDDNFGFNLNKYFQASQVNIYMYSSLSMQHNATINVQTIAGNGAQSTSFVNRDGQYNLNGSMGLYKQFKKMGKFTINTNTSLSEYLIRNLNIINEVEGWQKTYSTGINQGINLNYDDKVELNTNTGYRFTNTNYDYGDHKKIRTNNFNLNNNLVVRWPKKIIWETKQEYSYNPQVSPGFQKGINVISSSIALQMLKKDRGEIKVTGYDLFNQNTSVFRYAGDNIIYDVQNNTLKRYFLLTFTYKFNKLSTK
ncbi:outer membrane beta-barrel protein [Mucilaginibacter flavus]|uniref:outer membrane beta-barrel protein n=1 Tax=Mucilaginibacter flavus TaxID=931504 RepID=UPI0025B52F20|nr:outer membrane beta-barrel protein [Mucilaginibacter flavus]MDN3582950.1 outer membrane beta-barrel protein [Mucilaginibacter flavus]